MLLKSFSRYKIAVLGLAASAVFASSLFIAPPAEASDRESMRRLNALATNFKRTVRDKLDCPSCGYCRTYARSKGYLSQGNSYIINTTLYRGYDYVIMGAGDSSVKDLDLKIYDANWNLINEDTSTDNVPMVKASPRWKGRFHIKVKMYRGSGYPNIAICHLQPG